MDNPADAADVIDRTLTVETSDGHRAGLAVRAPTAARAGLLFVPALGVPARKYAAFAQALAARGVAVALHELRGNGTSSVRAGRASDWGYLELLRDLVASRTRLAEEFPRVRWSVGGHSLGAQLAALELALRPSAYEALVVIASGQPWWRGFPALERPFVLAVFGIFRALAALCGYFPGDRVGFGAREARTVIREWSRSGFSGRYVLEGLDVDLEAALARIERPVLAFHLRDDRFAPRRSLELLLAKMPRAQVRLQPLVPADFESGRANHFSWLREPGPVADRIVAGVESRAGG